MGRDSAARRCNAHSLDGAHFQVRSATAAPPVESHATWPLEHIRWLPAPSVIARALASTCHTRPPLTSFHSHADRCWVCMGAVAADTVPRPPTSCWGCSPSASTSPLTWYSGGWCLIARDLRSIVPAVLPDLLFAASLGCAARRRVQPSVHRRPARRCQGGHDGGVSIP